MKRSIYPLIFAMAMAFILFIGINARAAGSGEYGGDSGDVEPGEEITITFDYGIQEEYLKQNNYKIGDYEFPKSVKIQSGEYFYTSEVSLPETGKEVGQLCFSYWDDGQRTYSSYYLNFTQFYEDTTITAYYEHSVTYHAGDGLFEDGTTELVKYLGEEDTIADISPCCYANNSKKAFVGWTPIEGGTEQMLVDSSFVVYQNVDLYAVYVDGYTVTFNVNTENGYFTQYCESHKDYEGYRYKGETCYFNDNVQTFTVTYPKNVQPSAANYFCYNPIYNEAYMNPGDNSLIFKCWSKDKDGKEEVDFDYYTPSQDGNDVLYANWSGYWTVTFDQNKEEGYNYQTTEEVIKGESISNIPYSSFNYRTDDASRTCISFNTEKDGSGTEVDGSFIPTGNITVYAQYKDTYTIYLDGNDGYIWDSYYREFVVDQGEEFKDPMPSKVVIWPDEEEGKVNRKVVEAWNTKEDGSGDNSPFTPTKNTTLYAIPEDGVLITFDTNAQNGDKGNEYGTLFSFRNMPKYASEATFAYSTKRPMDSVPQPQYINDDKKQFAGWSTVYGDKSKVIDPYSFIPTKDMTLYATWNDMAEITYHANGGKFSYWNDDNFETSYAIKGTKISPYDFSEPFLDGYVFSGWTEREGSSNLIPDKKYYTVTDDMNFYAAWESGYTITLKGNGGQLHYMSSGGSEHFDENNEGDAVFVIKKGATVLDPDAFSSSSSSESPYSQVSGWREDNYVLAGFSKTNGGEPVDLNTYVPTSDETFYAVWEAPCVITFDANGGTFEYSSEVTDVKYVGKGGSVYYTPTPVLENKYFAGWFTDLGEATEKTFNTSTIVNSNITVKAKWVDDMVKVIYNAGDNGTFNYSGDRLLTQEITVGKGAEIDVSEYHPYVFGNADVSFGGWKTANYTWDMTNSSFYKVTADTVFEAIWNTNTYFDIAFDGNGGMVESSLYDVGSLEKIEIGVVQGTAIGDTFYAYDPKNADMEFTGWYYDKACTEFAVSAAKVSSFRPTKNITLYAGFTEKKVAVASIALSRDSITLGVSDDDADTFLLQAIVYPSNATNDKVVYSSSNENVAKVSASGLITAIGAGETTITATTADGGFKATCKVTVTSVTAASVNKKIDTLTEALESATSPAEAEAKVKEVLEEIGGADRLSELSATNSDTAAKLKDLEDAYKAAANVTVEDPDNQENRNVLKEVFNIGEDDVKGTLDMTGAALNAKAGESIELSIKSVPENKETAIDEKYENAKQLDIDLVKGDGTEVDELDSSVTFSLPIPNGVIRSKLYILHFNEDGTYELIRPVFKGNRMYITVSHFSRFVIAELAENASSGDKPSPTATPTATIKPSPTAAKPTPTSSNIPVGPTTAPTSDVKPSASPEAVKDGATVSETGSTATYKVNSAADKTVTYTGDSKASGKVTVKSSIKVGNNTYTVVAIANNAFKKKNITAVTIPATVETIGKSAFEGCAKLKTVTIKGSKLKTIGDNAFKGCKVLSKITIPKSVTKVGKQAFANCTKLKTITVKSKKTKFLKNSLKKVPSSAKVKLPKMTSKEKKAFKKMLKKTAAYKGKYK